jgi:CRP-like cAMP-binding protein
LVPEENNKIGSTKVLNARPNKKGRGNDDDDLLNNAEMDDRINPILYIRGVPNDAFYLLLSGKVMICSGNEGFFLEQGPFNYMGVDGLTNDNYVPDFSAKVLGKTKLLKITRTEYRKALGHIGN